VHMIAEEGVTEEGVAEEEKVVGAQTFSKYAGVFSTFTIKCRVHQQ